MTRLLFIPDSHTLLWLELAASPEALVESILRGDWQPPPPYAHLKGKLAAYWQTDLVIATAVPLNSYPTARQPGLSRRSREILKGILDGLTTRQMALRLGIHPRTIYHHVSHLKNALGVSSRAELAVRASELLSSESNPCNKNVRK